jgi:hypothetical protein
LKDPLKFLKGYFPQQFSRSFSDDQVEAIGIIIDCARYSTDEIIAAPRGDWKTETLKDLVIYLMLSRVVRFPVWIGSTSAAAKTSFDHIKQQFQNPLLAEDFPEVCDPIIAVDGSPQRAGKQTYKGALTRMEWRVDRCVFPTIEGSPYSGMKLAYRGLDTDIRGINVYGDRPDIALLDDLETRESADSEYQIGIRERLLDNDVGGLGSGETIPRIVLGTVQNRKCLTFKKLQEWGGKRYQAVYQWPDSERAVRLRDEYIDLRQDDRRRGDKAYSKSYDFYQANQLEIEEGLELGNPHNKSTKSRKDGRPLEISAFQRVLNAAADKRWAYVHSELQNDPEDDNSVETPGLRSTLVASRIHGGSQGDWPEDALYRTTCIDIGKFASHWVDVAWTGDAIGRVVDYGVAETHGLGANSSDEAIELAILKMLVEWRDDVMSWSRVPDLCLVDSGDYTTAVYEFVRQVGGLPFCASKGWDSGRYRTHKPGSDRIVGDNWNASHQPQQGLWLYNVNVDYWKAWCHQRWLTRTFDDNQQLVKGSLSLFASDDRRKHVSYSHHIVAEEYREEFKPGRGIKRGWHKLNRNNHWLDATVLACAAGSMLGANLVQEAAPVAKPRVNGRQRFGLHGRPYLATDRE